MDPVTSLPLTHSLLNFYRERLKTRVREPVGAVLKQLNVLQSDINHVHDLESALDQSTLTIEELKEENSEITQLLKEMIEDNARLRLNKYPSCTQPGRIDDLVRILERPQRCYEDRRIFSNVVDRCQKLEAMIAEGVAELVAERKRRENAEIKLVELEEALHYNVNELTDRLEALSGAPSIEDFEYVKSQVKSLESDGEARTTELEVLRAENLRLQEIVNAKETPVMEPAQVPPYVQGQSRYPSVANRQSSVPPRYEIPKRPNLSLSPFLPSKHEHGRQISALHPSKRHNILPESDSTTINSESDSEHRDRGIQHKGRRLARNRVHKTLENHHSSETESDVVETNDIQGIAHKLKHTVNLAHEHAPREVYEAADLATVIGKPQKRVKEIESKIRARRLNQRTKSLHAQ